ncbi:MAG: S-methyl-5-thioribose-1-phosphate isomerase [Candidatus Cloacimonadota bacterium]|nr:MAG: S-methyl-5-thioribose-1-phosphate isomerase [Candidatus Cloacimonadota bacterium]
MRFNTIEWKNNSIRILDQRELPLKEIYLEIRTVKKLANSIKRLSIRGAPAIGIAAGYGVALSSFNSKSLEIKKAKIRILNDIEILRKTRPTAVNLFWALERMKEIVDEYKGREAKRLHHILFKEAKKIHKEDKELCRRIGKNGAQLIPSKANIMTHCNAGALATGGWGTALGVIYAAKKMRKTIHVYIGETRPLLQGARLTTWELWKNDVPVTLVVDSARATLLKEGRIDLIIVGADRIASNGDVANKIGTYPLALIAKRHRVDFYVAAPSTTFDLSIKSGAEIPIEERDEEEVKSFSRIITTPDSINVFNPAFDVTPNELITGIITEKGVLRKPFKKSIKRYINPNNVKTTE